ncbi:MAG: glycosyltransferase family 4 protein, partial [Pirellula staleyi]
SSSRFACFRVAVVHDFLYTIGGAERVIEQIINAFPHCDLFALFDFLPENQRDFLKNKSVTTSFIQNLPFARSKHRSYLGLMPLAIEQLDVSNYDLVISSSYLAAKGVITGPEQLHVCYCHSPARYAWDLQHQYLAQAKLGYGIKGMIARAILHYIRMWDLRSALGVDHFIANSKFVANRIDKLYHREATIIHPPVDTTLFQCCAVKEDYYVVTGRMVPYKRTDLIVRAFSRTPNRRLVVIGDGPEMKNIRAVAGPNVEFLGFQDNEILVEYVQRAKALVFAAEEDFGIVPVEALACGTPVIAFGKGGVTESVVHGKHGVFYDSQTEESLLEALDMFESQADFCKFVPSELRRRSMDFSPDRFISELTKSIESWVQEKWPERFNPISQELSKEPTTSKDELLGSTEPTFTPTYT